MRRLPWTKVDSPPGAGGRIDIPLIGAHVGDMGSWKLRRRDTRAEFDSVIGENPLQESLFDLHAVLTWINVPLWEDTDYQKEIIIDFGRIQKRYRLDQQPGFPVILNARNLIVEGVIPCLLDQ